MPPHRSLPTPRGSASSSLTPSPFHAPIQFLTTWALKVFTADYSLPSTWEYLDKVGLMHTGQSAGFKHRETKPALFVDLLACSLLLGWVETVLISAVLPIEEEVLPLEAKTKVLGAVNKILCVLD